MLYLKSIRLTLKEKTLTNYT